MPKNQNEGQTEELENKETSSEESTENTQEEESTETEESSSSGDDVGSRLSALEAQHTRAQEENAQLRETLRLTQQYLTSQQQGKGNQNQEDDLSPDLRELDKTLAPLYSKHLKTSLEPFVGTVSKLYDQNDAVHFQLFMQRNHPEMFVGENFDKISQVVDSVRQRAAQQQGSWVSRTDAFHYAEGSGMLKSIKAQKVSGSAEKKRQAEKLAAGSGNDAPKAKVPNKPDGEVAKIREKAHRGERLTAKERDIWRESLKNVEF
jgi:succinate dehydrogenase flavin-adding protein (antitoxin of CptAB toxin-antitoxin module)